MPTIFTVEEKKALKRERKASRKARRRAEVEKVKVRVERIVENTAARSPYLTHPTIIDRVLDVTILPLIPSSVTPNQMTTFRFVMTPIVGVLLFFHFYAVGLVVFALAALSDALDGARARMNSQITTWGIIFDPVADKFLIGTVALIVISTLISFQLAALMVGLEVFLIASVYVRFRGKVIPAKTAGKIKMILQCVGVLLLLLYALFSVPFLLVAATYVLYAAIGFALLSLIVYHSV